MSPTNTSMQELVLIHPEVRLWSGSRKIDRETDLKQVASKLPPEAMMSSGSKRLVLPKRLAEIRKAKNRLEAGLFEEFGFRFLGGAAILTNQLDEALRRVHEIRDQEFWPAVRHLVNNLPAYYEEQEQAQPSEFREILRQARIPRDDVRRRYGFDYSVYRAVVSDDLETRIDARHSVESKALPALMKSIASSASKVYAKSFEGRSVVTRKVLPSIDRILNKLDRFSFIDPRVSPTVHATRQQLARLPKPPVNLDVADTTILANIVVSLTDPERILSHGHAVNQSSNTPVGRPQREIPIVSEHDSEPLDLGEGPQVVVPPVPKAPPSSRIPSLF